MAARAKPDSDAKSLEQVQAEEQARAAAEAAAAEAAAAGDTEAEAQKQAEAAAQSTGARLTAEEKEEIADAVVERFAARGAFDPPSRACRLAVAPDSDRRGGSYP